MTDAAGCAVRAELRDRNGHAQKISVNVESMLTSLIRGMRELSPEVSRLLSELVEREKTCGACAEGDEDDADEEDEEDPPVKRSRT
ncbi:uncharacterized protein si:dkeyp-55f12.3 [Scomber scombrus]|uniref:Uncharacterized protein si:dkeyp-55f12.3 n=1 Tax=Scomber scombrus TaxID=13677 RepID=A0AAV1QG81_SCOSC